MIDGIELITVVIATLAAAISGGAFFAFSNFVMRSLANMPPSQGILAMQLINRDAPNPLFVAAIVGAGVVGVPVALSEFDSSDQTYAKYLFAGVILSLLAFAITMLFNVPRNNALDAVDPDSTAGKDYWALYLVSWTRWNTLRGIASLASVACYMLAIRGG